MLCKASALIGGTGAGVRAQHSVWIPRSPRQILGEARPQQLSLEISGRASQQQFLLPVHELVGEAMAAPTQFSGHVGSLEGSSKRLMSL